MGDTSTKNNTNTLCTQYLDIKYFFLRIEILICGITWLLLQKEV